MMTPVISVALGGAIGAVGRYGVNIAATRLTGIGFPWGTVTVNVLGSFLMGVMVVVLAHKGGMRFAPLLMTGMLGGFTTFSAFSLDAVTLFERGQVVHAAAYVIGTVLVGLIAIMAGMALTRWAIA
ncbi:CrcB protein [Yoonia maritima]|uniref:Fluoride-specific ion channel FluC n=1 Tax=Yoonia maritima TaxID=1435347 RepID=A0A2T0VWT5_9RHOB|nr:fluoride efflux transporter CrcB [Yoonia maritima]PRY76296.1 CrcB protein [Yoonia maritima]